MIDLGPPQRSSWDKNGVPMPMLRVPVLLLGQTVGYIDVWPDVTPDGNLVIATATQLTPDEVERMGFRLDMKNKTQG